MKKILNYILFSLGIVLLILIQMLFYNNFNINNCSQINAFYVVATLGAMLYGYITSKYYTMNLLIFGKTRKEIYFDYLKRIIINLIIIIIIILTYLIFNYLIYQKNTFNDFFNFRKIIYFTSCYLFFASWGYFNGIVKLKFWIVSLSTLLFSIILIVIEVLGIVSYAAIVPIVVISVILFLVNSKIIYKCNIN